MTWRSIGAVARETLDTVGARRLAVRPGRGTPAQGAAPVEAAPPREPRARPGHGAHLPVGPAPGFVPGAFSRRREE